MSVTTFIKRNISFRKLFDFSCLYLIPSVFIFLIFLGLSYFARRKRRFTFKIPLRISARSITMAQVRLPQLLLRMKLKIIMRIRFHEKTVYMMSRLVPKRNLTFFMKPGGWLSFSLTDQLRDYMKSKVDTVFGMLGATALIELSFIKLIPSSPLATNLKPFLVLETVKQSLKRTRRGVDCSEGTNSVCCRAKLTVDFADIGLHQHMIEPKRFEAYQCVGTCGALSHSATTRVDLVKSVRRSMREQNKNTDHIKFCCSAARTSPQKLIYYNNDKTEIRTKIAEGLVVEECDCL